MSDPPQRGSQDGQALLAELRHLEAEGARELLKGCQEVAWLFHEDFAKYRVFVASLFFAIGDAVRAFAIAGPELHTPSPMVLRDLVEVSISLSTVDPLLQAVWLLTLGESQIPAPENIRYTLRQIAPEIQSDFKAYDNAIRNQFGVSVSAAYAHGVVFYFGHLWDESIVEHAWFKALARAVSFEYGTFWYHSGILRLLELFGLAMDPGERMPSYAVAMVQAGFSPSDCSDSDIRKVAYACLQADHWSTRAAHLGRSVAYDNSFYIEPWRRQESAAESLEILERHRYSTLRYWLMAVPPLLPKPLNQAEMDVVEQDQAMVASLRSIAFSKTVNGSPIFLRMYGPPDFKKLLTIEIEEINHYALKYRDQENALRAEAARKFPAYAERRFPKAATLNQVRAVLGIG